MITSRPTLMSNSAMPERLDEADYFEQRLDDQIAWFGAKSQSNQKTYKRLRLVEIIAGAAIPLVAGFGHGQWAFSLLIGILGLIVAVIAGALSLFRFQENWTQYRATAESLKQERFLYLARAFPYGAENRGDKAFELLVQRVEFILKTERSEWIQAMQAAGQGEEQARKTRTSHSIPETKS